MGKLKLKSAAILLVFSLFTGLFISTFDILLHLAGFQSFKLLNLFVYALFAFAIFWTASNYRDLFKGGFLSFWSAFRICFLIGFLAAIFIGIVRFVFLSYFETIDIAAILLQAEEDMLYTYPWLTNNQVEQKLAFLEFSYKPIVSSILYLSLYTGWAMLFSILSAFYVKRIDRDISDVVI